MIARGDGANFIMLSRPALDLLAAMSKELDMLPQTLVETALANEYVRLQVAKLMAKAGAR